MQNTERSRVHQLLQDLTHDRIHIRRSAVGTLVGIVVSAADVSPQLQSAVVTALLARLHDDDYSVCNASLRALRAIGTESDDDAEAEERIETLSSTLGSEFPNVRRFAINALADMIQYDGGAPREAPSALVTALLRCLQDEEHGVRSAAIRALRTIGTETQDTASAQAWVQLLLETLTNPYAYVRRFGINALIEVIVSLIDTRRELHVGVISALQTRLEDTDQGVRAAAANALRILS